MKYRPDIDGLRAIAVLSVLLFHGGISTFSGGFIGVDIFFVISGYLITTSIIEQKKKNNFSIIDFYERRARRILPALFLIMAVSIPFAWLYLLPKELRDYFQSIASTSTFISNIFFWKETGYFETSSELKPLLHTWSLAVEEQYYILFPIFIGVFWHRGRSWIFNSLAFIALISLMMAQISSVYAPSANFFLVHTRIWEILAGALIPLYLYKHPNKKFKTNTFWSLIGLFLICFSILFFDSNTPFPSLYATIPIVGTCLVIIYSDTKNLTGKILGNKFFVGIGLISYSIYLWHQPIFALTKQYYSIRELSSTLFINLSAITLFLSYFSWKYVEIPFRDKQRFDRRTIFKYSTVGLIFFLIIGITGDVSKGFKNRTTSSGIPFEELTQKMHANYGLSHLCEGSFTLNEACRNDDHPEILVWGDSYAMHLTNGIIASNRNAKIIQMTKSVCGPIFDLAPIQGDYNQAWAKGCIDFNDKVKEWLKTQTNIKYAVLSSPFEQYLNTENKLLSDGHITNVDSALVSKQFQKTLDTLISMNITPVIFSPPPANGNNIGRCLVQNAARGTSLENCDFSHRELANQNAFDFLSSFEDKYNIVRFDKMMCNKNVCSAHDQGIFLYRDHGHFSNEGTIKMGKKFNYYKLIDNLSD